MAIYRMVSMTFWMDSNITDEFTPEDRYFYLYLFTNPHTNLCGCYEISIKQISNEIGYSKDSVENLIKRFEKVHKVISFSKDTNEILLINWNKYNWTSSEKFRKPLFKEIENIKNDSFRDYLIKKYNGVNCRYGIDTSCSDTTDTVIDKENSESKNNTSKSEEEKEEQLRHDFELIYDIYPKKKGKTVAFAEYKKWVSNSGKDVSGTRYRLTNRQIYFAVKKYVRQQREVGQDDLQYWKNFDTLMGRQLLDYVDFEEGR